MGKCVARVAGLVGVLVAQLVVTCEGLQYDVIEPYRLAPAECTEGCMAWGSANATVQGWFRDPSNVAKAGAHCAQPAFAPGIDCELGDNRNLTSCDEKTPLSPSYPDLGKNGAFCLCAGYTGVQNGVQQQVFSATCRPQLGVPEQINVQIAAADTVALSFVTFEAAGTNTSADTPIAMVGTDPAALSQAFSGVTHLYASNWTRDAPNATGRLYSMHFVKLDGLKERMRYYYKVKGGSGMWSDVFSFRSGYTSGPTKIDMFGDMGSYAWSNMENLAKECAEGDAADLVVHLGDHSYNLVDGDERRGDGCVIF